MKSAYPLRRIDDAGDVVGGRQRSPHVTGTLRPYLRVANVLDGFIDTSDVLSMKFEDEEFERFRLRNGDILLNEGQSLELVGRAAVYRGYPENCAFQNTLIRFRAHGDTDVDFAYFVFRHLQQTGRFSTIATKTTSIAHLGTERFASMRVPWPSYPEQKAIGRILQVWYEGEHQVSRLLKLKRRLKRGLMQQLLTGRHRFPDFAGTKVPRDALPSDWPLERLSKIASRMTRKNAAAVEHVMTISGKQGFVDQREYFNRRIAAESVAGYCHLKRGEFAYNRSLMKGYPFGAIKRLDEFDEGVVSTLYICFALDESQIHSDFMLHLFESGFLNAQLSRITNLGSRAHGLLNVTATDFINCKVPVPSRPEQQKIAAVLTAADREIALLEQQLVALREQKKGLMQKLLTGQVRVKVASHHGATAATSFRNGEHQ